MIAVVLLACAAGVTSISWYVGQSLSMSAPTWDCSGTARTDRPVLARTDEAHANAPRAASVHVLVDSMSCWGTWVIRNDGVLPVHVADVELPVGGPGGSGFMVDAYRFDGGGESRTFAFGDDAGARAVGTSIYLETTIPPGGTRILDLRVVPSGRGCPEAGTTTRAPFTFRASIGPVGGGWVVEGQPDGVDATSEDPALVVRAVEAFGDC